MLVTLQMVFSFFILMTVHMCSVYFTLGSSVQALQPSMNVSTQNITLDSGKPNQTQRVNVSVFYETLCPHSVPFIQQQMIPLYSSIDKYMNVSFIPYGKALHQKNAYGRWIFACQHGPRECYGNKIQACALDALKDNVHDPYSSKGFQYIACFMQRGNKYPFESHMTSCFQNVTSQMENANKLKENFLNCANSTKGDELLAFYGNVTFDVDPVIITVPTVTINGIHDIAKSRIAVRNLKAVICDSLSPAPIECFSSSTES